MTKREKNEKSRNVRINLTSKLSQEICKLVSKGMPKTRAGRMLGVGPGTFSNWEKMGRNLYELRESEGAVMVTKHQSLCLQLYENLMRAYDQFELKHLGNIDYQGNEDWRASAWLLEATREYIPESKKRASARDEELAKAAEAIRNMVTGDTR